MTNDIDVRIEKLRKELNFAVEIFGLSDIITKLISQKLDKLISIKQKEVFTNENDKKRSNISA